MVLGYSTYSSPPSVDVGPYSCGASVALGGDTSPLANPLSTRSPSTSGFISTQASLLCARALGVSCTLASAESIDVLGMMQEFKDKFQHILGRGSLL